MATCLHAGRSGLVVTCVYYDSHCNICLELAAHCHYNYHYYYYLLSLQLQQQLLLLVLSFCLSSFQKLYQLGLGPKEES